MEEWLDLSVNKSALVVWVHFECQMNCFAKLKLKVGKENCVKSYEKIEYWEMCPSDDEKTV